MNSFLATLPFDLYELSLFHLVAEHRSFTRAGQVAGLTQSAMTRQIGGIEGQLGVPLFERTTRMVRLTAAGRLLYEKSKPILAAAESTLKDLQSTFRLAPQTLRVGVARSIGLAYYPGFFFAFRRRNPSVQLQVVQWPAAEILRAIEEERLDAGLLAPPRRLPRTLVAAKHFADQFVVIAPPGTALPGSGPATTMRALRKRLGQERWLLLDQQELTGGEIRSWLQSQGLEVEPAMELDGFDAIVNLVALGLGVSVVPHRVLALYGERRRVRRITLKPVLTRELGVVIRKSRCTPEPLASFIADVLF